MPETNLRFSGVSRRFGRLAVLAGVSGEVSAGQALLVTGANGSGKSTLLRCLAGLLAPDSGEIECREEGRSLDAAERRRRVGMVAPDIAFYEELTVAENLAFFARLRRARPERPAELLERVGLPGDRLAGALSSGMRQRLRWVWALLHRPRLLLLDEPFQNLDRPGETVTRELLEEHLAAGEGLAVIANPSSLEVSRVAARLELGGQALAVFAKDWRCEFRTRYALNTLALFAFTTLVVVSASLGPLGTSAARGASVLPVLLWLILLFAGAAGLPRSFVHEEETHTATALRLAATPSALFCGKLAYGLSLVWALELLVAPLFLAMVSLAVRSPGLFVLVLAAGGFGLAAGSTLIAAIIAQAQGRSTLFAVLAFPVLLPLLILVVELTRNAVVGAPAGMALSQLLLYDGTVTIFGLMLFPVVWNP